MKKRILSVLITLCMATGLLGAFSTTVSAAAPTAVYVGDVNVIGGGYWVSDGEGGITDTGASESNYTVKYASGTLTLNGADITKCYTSGTSKSVVYVSGDLDLVLLGENSLIAEDADYSYAILQQTAGSLLTISGSGSLAATSGEAVTFSYGIGAQNLVISGGTILAVGGSSDSSSGISSSGSIRITDGTVIATGGDTKTTYGYPSSRGIYSNTTIEISGGSVTATAGNAHTQSTGIFGIASVTISGDAVVHASGSQSSDESSGKSYGIATNMFSVTVFISGGSVQAQSGSAKSSSAIRYGVSLVNYTGYEWRTSAGGDFSADPYTWSEDHTFVEIRQGFVPVTGVTMVNTASVAVDTDLPLVGTVSPSNATNKTVSWSVSDAGTTGAAITGSTFRADSAGTATVTATVEDGLAEGSDYTQTYTITVTSTSPAPNPGGGSNGGGASSSGDSAPETESAPNANIDPLTGIRADGALSSSLYISFLTDTATGRANEVVNSTTYKELLQSIDAGYFVLAAYEIKADSYSGNLILTFPVDARHDGKQFIVKHRTSSGVILTYRGTVVDGKIVISVPSLSPFMIAIKDGILIPETGTAGFWSFITGTVQNFLQRFFL